MTIIRVEKARAYTAVPNATGEDASLSFRARGVLVWLLAKPDDWRVDSEAISRQGTEGRDAVRTALNELVRAGYLRRDRRQLEDGRWVTEVVVFERPPKTDSQASVNQASDSQALIPLVDRLKPHTPARRASRRRPEVPIPNPFDLSEELWDWAERECPLVDVEAETQNFVDWMRAKDVRYRDWHAAWKMWLRKTQRRLATGPQRKPA